MSQTETAHDTTNEAPTPVSDHWFRRAASTGFDINNVQDARERVAQWIAAAPDTVVADGASTIAHADDDVVIVDATHFWGSVTTQIDVDAEILEQIREAHNREARVRCDDIDVNVTGLTDMMVIDRSLLSNDTNVFIETVEVENRTCSECQRHIDD